MGGKVTIVTNNVPRNLLYWHELTEKEQAELCCQEDEVGYFFRYKGHVYDLGEFMRSSGFSGWDASISDTAFSGVLIKLVEDNEKVIVGRFYG